MLAWEGFSRAKAASYAEAALISDVCKLSAGFAEPEKSSIRNEGTGYPACCDCSMAGASGRSYGRSGSIHLNGLNRMAVGLHASDDANRDLHSLLLQALNACGMQGRRLLAAQSTIPDSSGSW